MANVPTLTEEKYSRELPPLYGRGLLNEKD